MLNIAVNADGLNQLIANLQATEDQARKALYSTMVKMAAWVRTRAIRGMSERVKIQQKILRQRVRTYRMGGRLSHATSDGSMKVWFGLNAVPWGQLQPRATRTGGVSASGGRHDPKAFMGRYGGKEQVLKRAGKERTPLVVVKAEIADEATEYIEEFVIASIEFETHFLTVFERELKWRTQTQR
jgi:hypothetical protein